MLVDLERGGRRPGGRPVPFGGSRWEGRERDAQVLRQVVEAEEPPLLHSRGPEHGQVLVPDVRVPRREAQVVHPGRDRERGEQRRREQNVRAHERGLVEMRSHAASRARSRSCLPREAPLGVNAQRFEGEERARQEDRGARHERAADEEAAEERPLGVEREEHVGPEERRGDDVLGEPHGPLIRR